MFFQVNLGHPVPPWILLFHLFWKEDMWISGMWFLQGTCPSCHPTMSVKALKGTQSTNPNQWPGLILSSFTAGVPIEGALLLCRLNNTSLSPVFCCYQQVYDIFNMSCLGGDTQGEGP